MRYDVERCYRLLSVNIDGWAHCAAKRAPSGVPILKLSKFAIKPVCDGRATADREVLGTCTRKAGLDRALDKESRGAGRKGGQNRGPPRLVATTCSNHPGQS